MSWSAIASSIGDVLKAPFNGDLAQAVSGVFGKQTQMTQSQNEITAAQKLNDFNTSEAQKNRDWQTQMSNTAYQRSTQDMIKAGINPILAYQQGGASTPSGSTASGAKANQAVAGRNPSGIMKSVQSIAVSALQVAKLLAL